MALRPNQIRPPSKKLSEAPAWVKSIIKDHVRRLKRLQARRRESEEQFELFDGPAEAEPETVKKP